MSFDSASRSITAYCSASGGVLLHVLLLIQLRCLNHISACNWTDFALRIFSETLGFRSVWAIRNPSERSGRASFDQWCVSTKAHRVWCSKKKLALQKLAFKVPMTLMTLMLAETVGVFRPCQKLRERWSTCGATWPTLPLAFWHPKQFGLQRVRLHGVT